MKPLGGVRSIVLAAAVMAAVFALPAAGAGIGPGRGPSSFTLEKLNGGASSAPRVALEKNGSALAVFVNFAGGPPGVFHVCEVPPGKAGCTRTAAAKPTDEDGAMSLVYSGSTLLLGNGTANYTELFTSGDGGASFGPAVRISNYVGADNVLPLPDGDLLLVGGGGSHVEGTTAGSNALHVVVVPPDGSGVDTQGFTLGGASGIGNRGVAYNGGRYVVLSGGFISTGSNKTRIEYAVYAGSGDPNSLANWTRGSVNSDFLDPPNIAGGPAGVVLVTLNGGRVMASKLNGTKFGPLKPIGDGAGKAYLPNVTQDATGRITATWQVNGVGLRESHSFDGTHWSAPRTLTSDREFDTDTATGPNGNGLAVTKADGRYLATRIYAAVTLTLKASSKRIAAGKQVAFTARLTDERGKPLKAQPISFQAGKKTIATRSTGKSGTARLTLTPSKTAGYRAVFAGTTQVASYTTPQVKVVVARQK